MPLSVLTLNLWHDSGPWPEHFVLRRRRKDGFGLGELRACRVVCDEPEPGVWPSDHFGVYAELRSEPE